MIVYMHVLLLFFVLALPVHAGTQIDANASAERHDPLVHYDSVFDGYQAYHHQAVAPWRQSNERVREVGGWRAYAREAAEPEGAEAPPQNGSDATRPAHDHGSTP